MDFSTVMVKSLKHERFGSGIRMDFPPTVLDVGIGYGDSFNKYKEYLLDVMPHSMCWKSTRIYNLENRQKFPPSLELAF